MPGQVSGLLCLFRFLLLAFCLPNPSTKSPRCLVEHMQHITWTYQTYLQMISVKHNATPIHHSQMPPQLSVVTCLNDAVSTPLGVRWPIFWGVEKNWYVSKREKVGCFFCWKGPPHWFLSLKNSDQKICATQMIQTQMMNRLAALVDDSPTGSFRSTPLNFRLPWLPKGTGARSDLIFCSSEKLLGWFFLIFRNNVTNSKDRGFILVRLGGRVLSFQGQSFLMRSVVLKFHIDDKHLDVIFVCF